MLSGESVTVLVPRLGEADAFGAPSVTWDREEVGNVLVCPSSGADALGSTRPDGTEASATLHFPKAYPRTSLRGCRVIVRGEEFRVVGDPMPLDDASTPTPWHMAASVQRERG